MKKTLKILAIYGVLTLGALGLTSCGKSGTGPVETTTEAPKNIVTLYVGKEDNMKEYTYTMEVDPSTPGSMVWDSSSPDPDDLIKLLSLLTGWNLTLASPVTVSPATFTISFADESSVFTGAASATQADFQISDQKELTETILDSIVYNLNKAYNEPVTIYFTNKDFGDIVVSGLTVSSSEPYAQPEEEIEE